MAANAFRDILNIIFRPAALRRETDEQSDGHLLQRFIGGDGAALETLVRRHAPMVWGVCRRTLARPDDAEDAFQATFLVLLRKAASIRPRDQLANWLYGVAYQTARKARQTAVKRYSREKQVQTMPEPPTKPADDAFGPELRARLDEELSRLPKKYRTAVVLCELQERSLRDAAQQLGVPEGTLRSRVARGRALLAQRLTRRGLGLSATSVAAVYSEQALGAMPEALLSRTIAAVRLMAAGQTVTAGLLSAQVAPLSEGLLPTMAPATWKAAAVVLLLAALVMAGGMVTHYLLVNRPIEEVIIRTKDHAQADSPVLVVAASYPGANAQEVADTVAAPIEGLINGVKGLVRIESTSDNEGHYTARLYFKAKTNLVTAMKLVKTRIWQAEPVLAPVVVRNKVTVRVGKSEAGLNKVTIAILDRTDQGWGAMKKVASVVVKRLEAEGALTKPQVIPGDEKQLYFDVDHAKCAALGVTPAEVFKALGAANSARSIHWHGRYATTEELKKVVVRGKVTLGDVAVFRVVAGPAGVYRIDLSPAILITGVPPEGKSVAAAAAKCLELTMAEMKRRARGPRMFTKPNGQPIFFEGIAVVNVNLSAK